MVSGPRTRCAAPLLVALALLATSGEARAGDAGPLPYDLVVEVGYGHPRGPESLRDEIEIGLSEELVARGCFRSARRFSPDRPKPGDLLLSVTLDRLNDELQFDLSIAERTSPGAPDDASRQLTATIEAVVTIRVSAIANGGVVRSRSFHRKHGHRPLVGEDARHEVTRQFVESVIHTTRSFACKGSPEKWAKQLQQARAADAGATR